MDRQAALFRIRRLLRHDYPVRAHSHLLSNAINDMNAITELWPDRHTAQPERLRLALVNGRAAYCWIVDSVRRRLSSASFGFSYFEACRASGVDGNVIRENLLEGMPADLIREIQEP